MASKKKTGLIIGGVLLLFLLGAGAASAKSSPTPIPEPFPEPEPEPKKPGEIKPPDTGNWGFTPPNLRDLYTKAEKASGIPGLGQFLAIWSWGAFRAMQEPVSPAEALIISAANPWWCRECLNDSAAEVESSQKGYDNALKNYPTLKVPKYGEQWRSYGSAGLFDILSGSHAWDLIYDGYTAPEFNQLPAKALNSGPVSTFMATVITRKILKSPNYKVLLPTSTETWTAMRRVTANPSAFLQDNNYSKGVGDRFQMRAKELGIDLTKVANPALADLANWPGAKSVYKAIVG